MAIYLSFLVPKITAIVHAMPTNARPTPSAWNHEHDRVSDFVPITCLLEWQWHRIVMRSGQFTALLEKELVGPPYAHTHSQSHFTQCCKHGWVSPPHPPAPPSVSTKNFSKCNKSLKDPVRGADSTQVQIRSYRNRQSGKLSGK